MKTLALCGVVWLMALLAGIGVGYTLFAPPKPAIIPPERILANCQREWVTPEASRACAERLLDRNLVLIQAELDRRAAR